MAPKNPHYGEHGSTFESPAQRAQAIIPSDSVELPVVTRGIYVGGAGTVVVVTLGGDEVSFVAPLGQILPVAATLVKATGTTASNMVALW